MTRNGSIGEYPPEITGCVVDSAGVVVDDNTSAKNANFPGIVGGVTAGTKGITFPAGSGGMPAVMPATGGSIPVMGYKPDADLGFVLRQNLERKSQKEIHDFIRANRKVIADLEDMVIALLRGESLISEEIVHGLLIAKERAYFMIEQSLIVLQERCTPVDKKEEANYTVGLENAEQILAQLCGDKS